MKKVNVLIAFSYFVMCQIVCGRQELWPRIARGPIGAIKHNKGFRKRWKNTWLEDESDLDCGCAHWLPVGPTIFG